MEYGKPTSITNPQGRELVSRTTPQGNVITDGVSSITIGFNTDGQLGVHISDGTVLFVSITKIGLVVNDGTNDRLLLGKDEGGF